jgi:hypothetical protein
MIARLAHVLILALVVISSAMPLEAQEQNQRWQFIKGISDLNLPKECHAQIYERPIQTQEAGLRLLPFSKINYAEIVCVGTSVRIEKSIFTNGGNVRIFAHDLYIAPAAKIDTRVHLPKSFEFLEQIFLHRKEYVRRSTRSFQHFLSNQYSDEFLTSLTNYYTACFDCELRNGEVFVPRLPDGLAIVNGYAPNDDVVIADINAAEGSIIANSLKSGSIDLHLSGSLSYPAFPGVEGAGYKSSAVVSGTSPKVAQGPIFTEDRKFRAFRVDSLYPSRPWLVGLPTCGTETRFRSLNGGTTSCGAAGFASVGKVRPVRILPTPGSVNVAFTDFGLFEMTKEAQDANAKDPYAFKINGWPIFGQADSFFNVIGQVVRSDFSADYSPNISPDVIRVRAGDYPCCDKNPIFATGTADALIDGSDSDGQLVKKTVSLLNAKRIESVDALVMGLIDGLSQMNIERTLSGTLPVPGEVTRVQGEYVLSDVDFVALSINDIARMLVKRLVSWEYNRNGGRIESDGRTLYPFEMISVSGFPLVSGGVLRSLHSLAFANELSKQSFVAKGGIIEGIAHTSRGIFSYLGARPRDDSDRYTQTFLALQGILAMTNVEAQIKLLREEQLIMYKHFVDYMTDERLNSIREKVERLEAEIKKAEKSGDPISAIVGLADVLKSSDSSGKGASKFLESVGISVAAGYFSAAVAAVGLHKSYETYSESFEIAERASAEVAELKEAAAAVAQEGAELVAYFSSRIPERTSPASSVAEAQVIVDTQEIEVIFSFLGRLAFEVALQPGISKEDYLSRLRYLESYIASRRFGVAGAVAFEPQKVAQFPHRQDWTCEEDEGGCLCLGDVSTATEGTRNLYANVKVHGEVLDLFLTQVPERQQFCFWTYGHGNAAFELR